MRRFLCLSVLFVYLLSPGASPAQSPLGSVAGAFPVVASKLVADPVRMRVYAALPTANSVAVIDTTTLTVTATIAIGSDPVDMAISPDNNTLYVVNHGSTVAAIAVLDLDTLAVTANFPLPAAPLAVAAGLDGRLYVAASPDNFSSAIYQVDSTSGVVQTTFNTGFYDNNLLTLSPDGTRLFEANNSEEPGDIKSFDVSTATPTALQVSSRITEFPSQLVVSHNGKYLCAPSDIEPVYLYSTADITSYYGSFASDADGGSGSLAFSPDDSLVYKTSGDNVEVFNTQTFASVISATLPSFGPEGYPSSIGQAVVENTGSYLFLGESSSVGTSTTGEVLVVATGAGTLTPPLPVVTVTATVPKVAANGSNEGAITITRAGNLSQELDVVFSLKGSAENGTDYQHLKLLQKIRPNKAGVTIHIIPLGHPATASTKVLQLVLQPSLDYQVSGSPKAKVKIIFGGQTGPGPL